MVKYATRPIAEALRADGLVCGTHCAVSVEAPKILHHGKHSDIQDLVFAMRAATVSASSATWGHFHFCAYGLKDLESGLRSLKPTSLMHCSPSEVMRPILRKCKDFTSSVKHEHQPLEGKGGTFGSRTKLAQVHPYQFCQDLARIILRHLKVKPLDNEVCLLEGSFEPFTNKQVDILRKKVEAIDKEFNMTSSSTAVRFQDLPFNKNVQPLVIQDQLVQKFHKTPKQYPPRLRLIFSNKIPTTGDVRTCGTVARR